MTEQTTSQISDRLRMRLDQLLDGTGDTCDTVLAAAGDPAMAQMLSPAGRAVLDGWRDATTYEDGDGCNDG